MKSQATKSLQIVNIIFTCFILKGKPAIKSIRASKEQHKPSLNSQQFDSLKRQEVDNLDVYNVFDNISNHTDHGALSRKTFWTFYSLHFNLILLLQHVYLS